MTGGRDTGSEFWGNADYTLNVDTGKLGLWPGGFLKVSADSGFGHSVLGESGAIVPVNTAAIIPFPGDQTTALTNATFMQFLSTKFGVMVGKVYTLDGFQGEFAGNYRSQFMNLGLVIPTVMDLVPISAFGGGIVALPLENILLSGRPLDTFGIGWARSDYTSNFVPFLRQQLDLGLDHDEGGRDVLQRRAHGMAQRDPRSADRQSGAREGGQRVRDRPQERRHRGRRRRPPLRAFLSSLPGEVGPEKLLA
jgi:hypothetical protein